MVSWTEWPDEEIKMRDEAAVKRYERKLKDDVDFWKFIQFKFYEQWESFRAYVNGLGIKILGDMPIYVAMDSADTWANPELFQLYDDGDPIAVAGCPPDYFSATGQLWGNPLYDWDYLEATDYEWWFERIKAASKLYDITRIDHFRAFASYYSIPYPAENAINGEWVEGPRIKFFNMMEEALGKIDIVAEDLGTLTPDVTELMEQTGYPGMKVLEFAFDSGEENDYLPINTPKTVLFTQVLTITILLWAGLKQLNPRTLTMQEVIVRCLMTNRSTGGSSVLLMKARQIQQSYLCRTFSALARRQE